MNFAEDKVLLNEKNIEIIIDIDVTTSLICKITLFSIAYILVLF